MKKVKLIIFDLDGTLVNAYKAIEKSIYFTLKKLGYPLVSPSRVRRAIGWGDKNFIRRFIRSKEVKKGLKIYQKHHKLSLLKYSQVIPGARRVLSLLKKRNYKLAIASNRPQKFTKILLNHLDLKKYFDTVVCAKGKNEIKPNPIILNKVVNKLKIKKNQALYVGDMVIDVRAGKNSGIKTIAVLGGLSSKAELKRTKPFRIIRELPNLLNLLSFCLIFYYTNIANF